MQQILKSSFVNFINVSIKLKGKKMRKSIFVLCALLAISSSAFAAKSVIVLVPDGCSQSILTAARWYKSFAMDSNEPLALDEIGATGLVKTYMANSIITDSASAASAFASGYKNTDGMLGVGAADSLKPNLTGFSSPIAPYAPMETILEAAKVAGKSTGLVATSRISHATPAAYACHQWTRNNYGAVQEDMVYNGLTVSFGGAERYLKGNRTDGEDLEQVLLDRGYSYIKTRDELLALPSDTAKAWGSFAWSDMQPDLDRGMNAPTEPSLSEMTAKAIEILSQNENGFFIMIEGSQVDWAGHANDPIYMITDFLAFDEAVRVALNYAKTNEDTLVMVYPDHNTGALSIGHEQGGSLPGYTSTEIATLIDPIKDASVTVQTLITKYPANPTPADVRAAFVQYWGDFWNVMTDDQAQNILDMGGDSYGVSSYISAEFTAFGWTSHGHTGEDVPMWCYAGANCELPIGTVDNTDLAFIAADAMGITLNGTDPWVEYDESVLDTTDLNANPVATIDGVQYPVSKNIKILADSTVEEMNYITVYAPKSGKVYIPVQ